MDLSDEPALDNTAAVPVRPIKTVASVSAAAAPTVKADVGGARRVNRFFDGGCPMPGRSCRNCQRPYSCNEGEFSGKLSNPERGARCLNWVEASKASC